MNYKKHYNALIERARTRNLDCYTERHHVIPRCMGGSDEKDNLVRLTPEEHYLAHLLLVKIYPLENKLVLAARYMTVDKDNKRSNNKMYGWLRRKFIEIPRPCAEETKEKISRVKKSKKMKHTEESKEKMRQASLSQKTTDEKRRKCSIAGKKAKGILKTEEHKKSLSLAALSRPRVTCEHCGKNVTKNMYARWHGEKCTRR